MTQVALLVFISISLTNFIADCNEQLCSLECTWPGGTHECAFITCCEKTLNYRSLGAGLSAFSPHELCAALISTGPPVRSRANV
eukprot:6196893-Pleurochrysis_carterae.AAC.1